MNTNVPLVTILINNFNYGRYLHQAIQSAIDQTYPKIEVVVVDDGSTDESPEVIRSYGDRIVPVFKKNGGQASALNAGVAASTGEIIFMLDADDWFYKDKVERIVPLMKEMSILHHPMKTEPNGGLFPPGNISPIDAYAYAKKYRFIPFLGSPTSGVVITRDLALRLMPLPNVRSSADDFIVRGGALLGTVIWMPDVLGAYRIHGNNIWFGTQGKKSNDFNGELETYLNQKLIENGREPVIAFFHSMYGRESIEQDPGKLAHLAVEVFWHSPDVTTLKFMVKTLALAAKRKLA